MERLDPQRTWNKAKKLKYNKDSQPSKNRHSHQHKEHTQQNSPHKHKKANILNKYFKSTSTHSSNPMYRITNKLSKSLTPTPVKITAVETTQAIKLFENNNCPRLDNVNIRHLKHLGPIAIKHVTNLFNTTINKNLYPIYANLSKSFSSPDLTKTPHSPPHTDQ